MTVFRGDPFARPFGPEDTSALPPLWLLPLLLLGVVLLLPVTLVEWMLHRLRGRREP